MKNSVNILGTEYKIERHKVSEDKTLKENHFAGYCDEEEKLIVFGDVSEDKYFDMSEQAKKTFEKRYCDTRLYMPFSTKAVCLMIQIM